MNKNDRYGQKQDFSTLTFLSLLILEKCEDIIHFKNFNVKKLGHKKLLCSDRMPIVNYDLTIIIFLRIEEPMYFKYSIFTA